MIPGHGRQVGTFNTPPNADTFVGLQGLIEDIDRRRRTLYLKKRHMQGSEQRLEKSKILAQIDVLEDILWHYDRGERFWNSNVKDYLLW